MNYLTSRRVIILIPETFASGDAMSVEAGGAWVAVVILYGCLTVCAEMTLCET